MDWEELEELAMRLVRIDVRLAKAKKARDEYVNFLQKKYPSWKPPGLMALKPSKIFYEMELLCTHNQSKHVQVVDKTGRKYFRNSGRSFFNPNVSQAEFDNFEQYRTKSSRIKRSKLSLSSISSDQVFESDVAKIRKGLDEINKNLNNLQERRFYLFTERPNASQIKLQHHQTPAVDNSSSSYKKNNQKEDLMQEHANNISEDNYDNYGVCLENLSDDVNKTSDNLKEKQEGKIDPTVELLEAKSVMQTSLPQKILKTSKKEEFKHVEVAEKSKYEKNEHTTEIRNQSAATNDGLSFLEKILGSSAFNKQLESEHDFKNEKPTGFSGIEEDSDSDFFA
ncbi:unnamed protein product [Thelazia callipaeda]|uniref:Clathrin light chain n=1 Tax=Thelazia callipaeda TaxID=103827 RepID=A0A0N5CVG4_THECL|nr:unnamed protein product [Thelazia callipaeda]